MRIKRSKYNAVPTVVEGVRFASKREAARYTELKLLERVGQIRNLKLQPSFALMAPVIRDGLENINAGQFERVSPIGAYRADFMYEERVRPGVWVRVIEDAKGYRTELYRWKKRHVERQYEIVIREV